MISRACGNPVAWMSSEGSDKLAYARSLAKDLASGIHKAKMLI